MRKFVRKLQLPQLFNIYLEMVKIILALTEEYPEEPYISNPGTAQVVQAIGGDVAPEERWW